ncbi:MAG: hypothetical protein HY587_08265 [Candidatus Omnitrophica bacterium]|nr:hypothetical protein [Candidatus Omnitrophota bacterium]
MRVALVFNKDRPETMGIYIERAFRTLGIPCDHFSSREAERIPLDYDLYFRIDDDWYERDLPEQLKPRALWAGEVHLKSPRGHLKKMAPRYDFVFTPSTVAAENFKRKGINTFWVSYGCDPEIHRRVNLPKKFNLAFVGTEGGIPRKFYLQELRERYPNSFIGRAPHTQMGEIYSQPRSGFSLRSGMNVL